MYPSNRIGQLRLRLDQATEGGLYALNSVSKEHGFDPHLVIQTDGLPTDYTRVVFFATEGDEVRYFDTAIMKGQDNRLLGAELRTYEAMREAKKAIARAQVELARYDAEDDTV